jgi:hypothetical protein
LRFSQVESSHHSNARSADVGKPDHRVDVLPDPRTSGIASIARYRRSDRSERHRGCQGRPIVLAEQRHASRRLRRLRSTGRLRVTFPGRVATC